MHAFATEGLDLEKREEFEAILNGTHLTENGRGTPDTKAKAQRERAAVEAALRESH